MTIIGGNPKVRFKPFRLYEAKQPIGGGVFFFLFGVFIFPQKTERKSFVKVVYMSSMILFSVLFQGAKKKKEGRRNLRYSILGTTATIHIQMRISNVQVSSHFFCLRSDICLVLLRYLLEWSKLRRTVGRSCLDGHLLGLTACRMFAVHSHHSNSENSVSSFKMSVDGWKPFHPTSSMSIIPLRYISKSCFTVRPFVSAQTMRVSTIFSAILVDNRFRMKISWLAVRFTQKTELQCQRTSWWKWRHGTRDKK